MNSLADTLAVARWRACLSVPYLARALWACSYVESSEVPTFAIDERWRVMVNPAFAEACAADGTLGGCLVHEALHQVLRHGPRYRAIDGTDHARWNRAGDREINGRIDEIPALRLPAGALRAADHGWPKGKPAEHYYMLDQTPSGFAEACAAGAGGAPGTCAGGSGAGCPHPAEKDLPVPGEPGPTGLSEAEGTLVRASVAAAIKAAHGARPGSVPGSLLRWAEEYGDAPAIDWSALAAARIRYAVEARRGPAPSYGRPSRRTLPGGIILPVYRQPTARIAIVCDTSASMGSTDIGTALAIIVDACNAIGTVTALSCDAAAGDAITVRHVDDLRPYFTGGGGTNMVAGIRAAAESVPEPACIVVVTDGETPWPASPPATPVVIILTRNPSYCGAPPPWAEVIAAYKQ